MKINIEDFSTAEEVAVKEKKKNSNHIPTQKEVFMEMNRDRLEDMIEHIKWKVEPFYDDKWWKYKVTYFYCDKEVFTDHWHVKPDDEQIKNSMVSSLRDGAFGDQIMELLWNKEMAQYKKYKLKDEKGRPKTLE